MRLVSFVTTQDTDKDLIVSFALQDDDPSEIESLTLLRTPVYEAFLLPHERGVSVSMEGEPEREEANRMTTLHKMGHYVHIQTHHGEHYHLDVSKVRPSELEAAKRVLKKMNFDESFELVGM